jgi:hypothetical protein
MAAAIGETLASIGVEVGEPTPAHRADALVGVGADAMDLSPRAGRVALHVAFQARARDGRHARAAGGPARAASGCSGRQGEPKVR